MLTHRQIVRIDGDRCTGCGDCILACAEGAIEIVDGKARLVSETLCDGFGACLGECPEDAILIEEREAEPFDEDAVKEHLASLWIKGDGNRAEVPDSKPPDIGVPATCPSAQMMEFTDRQAPASPVPGGASPAGPALGHWPIKLRLVPPGAPFLQGADLMLIADCVPFASSDLYQQFLPERAVLIGCPKFDDFDLALSRLAEILCSSDVRSLTVVYMEVPCCSGYWYLGQKALKASGKTLPLQQVVIGIRGEVKQAGGAPPS